jgi:hypothetical protein
MPVPLTRRPREPRTLTALFSSLALVFFIVFSARARSGSRERSLHLWGGHPESIFGNVGSHSGQGVSSLGEEERRKEGTTDRRTDRQEDLNP